MEGMLYDAERDLLAIAKFLVILLTLIIHYSSISLQVQNVLLPQTLFTKTVMYLTHRI